VKRLIALFVGVAFVTGIAGLATAQTPAPKTEEKKTEKPADHKKMAMKSANGTVKSSGADGVVVSGKEKGKETEWTFAVDPKTKIKKAGKDVTAADLAAGDAVHVRYMEQDGKAMASAITVRAPKKTAAKPAAEKPAAEKPAAEKK
jgi:lipopolysaccharide export LptBFGC system permease protein LptF